MIKSLPAMAAVTIAGLTMQAAPAQAAPSQPGVTSPQGSQPGVTSTPQTAPATPPPPAPKPREYLDGYQPSPQVQQTPSRSYDDYLAGNQQSSNYQNTYYEAPAPQAAPSEAPPALQATPPPPPPVPTVQRKVIAPIEAPPGTFIAGGKLVPVDTNIVDQNLLTRTNNTLQAIQADGGNWLVDNGFADAPRADRIAAGTATGVITGGAVGLAASVVPAAVITGTAAAIGGGLGLAATTAATPAVIWAGPVGYIFVPGAAALAGAGVGAALSAPIVLGLTGTGAVIGGILGATVLGGEQQIVEEPAPAPAVVPPAVDSVPAIPPAATVDLPGPVGQVRDTLAADPDGRQVLAAADTAVQSAAPIVAKAVSDASVWTAPAASAVQGFTSKALEQPHVAQTVETVQSAAAPLVDQATAALGGLQAAFAPA
ncbi:hypothetical protein CH251_12380 [Rhodococcus sp. 06-462-5]|uniref:hypothetical protein n=1 Tax=unclassified Rhodococcus (in: high G+C Gram-positive bacteria) TaxID=192944 RepID=UPI000B9B3A1A|nr:MULTISPECIES: hypothetical protein [unclassified Rhodococcus (in: high G+C Gram-positive bacteria)]OZC73923.1 hypothetical protein CH251_12380 [Rhodococcus sp. 06-462-5]OZE67920.1 hypothetical protein CH270_09340 [Rhodococcus sp. 02-925g]